jgi:hypothetical protein
MANVPLRFISEQDYKDEPGVVKLLRPLNDIIRSISGAFANALTFKDNCTAQTDELVIHVPADGTTTYNPYPFSFTWRYPQLSPQHCIITLIEPADTDAEGVFSGVIPRWRYDNGRVIILGLRGDIQGNRQYKVRFFTFV